jgi:hypothetical protein
MPLEPALRCALEEATLPSVSAGFDSAVLAGATRRGFAWEAALRALTPALAGAICFFVVGTVFLRWFTALPVRPQPAPAASVARRADRAPVIGRPHAGDGSLAAMLSARVALMQSSEYVGAGY